MGQISDKDFTAEPADFIVEDGIVIVTWPNHPASLRIPLAVFRINLQRANRAVDEWVEAHPGSVLPFKARKRRS